MKPRTVTFEAPDLLTPAQAMALTGLDHKALGHRARIGALASVRTPGGHRRYVRASVESLAASIRGGAR